MAIDIRIQIELSSRQKRIVRAALVAGAVTGALGAGVVLASPPNRFQTGTVLSAAAMNANFDYLDTAITRASPAGVMVDYAGTTAPEGWLLCDGTVRSQATYPGLFAVIGSTYNTGGEGAGNFRLPNSLGRVSVGAGAGASLTARQNGQSGGFQTISVSQMPSHTHTDSGHTHVLGTNEQVFLVVPGSSEWSTSRSGGNTNVSAVTGNTSAAGAANIQATGGGAADGNMPPFMVATRIIKI